MQCQSAAYKAVQLSLGLVSVTCSDPGKFRKSLCVIAKGPKGRNDVQYFVFSFCMKTKHQVVIDSMLESASELCVSKVALSEVGVHANLKDRRDQRKSHIGWNSLRLVV